MLEEVHFSKALIVLSCETNPNPYDFSSVFGDSLCINLYRDKMKITRVRVEYRVGYGTI